MLNNTPEIRRNILLAIVAWSLIVGGSLGWAFFSINQESIKLAQHEARAYINKDIAFRNWAASHGGVYVPPGKTTPPNPYLAFIPDRDVTTTSGKTLTLMNPAYMLREMQSRFSGPSGERGRLTSLNPLNPDNAPDAWESRALLRFEQGETEISEISDIAGAPWLRTMRPFIVEQGCIKCHSQQGYRVGDVRGGIGVAIPMKIFHGIADQAKLNLATGHGVIWIAGLIILGFFARRAIQHHAERAQTEEAIHKLNEALETRVQERTAQLTATQDALVRREKLAMLGQVAVNVGHELRNPLGAMSNAVYFLQTVLTDADETTSEYLNIIKNEIAVSERIVADLMDAVRTSPPQPATVTVAELIDPTLRDVPASVTVKLDIPETLPVLRVDAQQIHQALRNLISNSVEAMPDGGTLKISAVENAPAKTITLSVQDTGVGMTAEQLDHLFEPLFTTKARGIGLGLVVAKNLVEANGGTVVCRSGFSPTDKGTTFTVTLPAADEKNIST
ncbi:MAG: DUF3365 domain-containing protein [Gallionella sp.]|nr:DUF3365 domain-containing protein [Gallionella sp.]